MTENDQRGLTRRQMVTAGAIGVGGLAVGAGGMWVAQRLSSDPGQGMGQGMGGQGMGRATGPSHGSAASGRPLPQPKVLRSSGGTLEVTLTAGVGASVAGQETEALAYNGTVPGPTLQVRPGDTLRVLLRNELGMSTNLHTHGLHVSPEGNSDNVFREVKAGSEAAYEFVLPKDHATGTFWYHPHHHGMVADQVSGGMYGMLLVTGDDEPAVDAARVLVVSDITLTESGEPATPTHMEQMMGREGSLLLVDGEDRPRIDMVAGHAERWRVLNACAARFLRVQLDDHTLGLLGLDGHALQAPRDVESVLLAPGNRADLIVRPTRTGRFTLRTLDVDRGSMGMGMMRDVQLSRARELASVVVAAGASGTPYTTPRLPSALDLRSATVDGTRTVTFTMGGGMGMGGMTLGIDGRTFDPARVDQRMRLGTVEEWVLRNTSPMAHPFHIHVWPFQVIEAPDSDPAGPPDWRDVVIVPPQGQVRIRMPVKGFGGRTVFHCHIFDHEDLGMMGVVEVR